MKLLLIGGTGNLSTDCATQLHHDGHELHLLTRGHSEVPAGYHAHQADRKDAASLKAALAGQNFDAVVDFIGFAPSDIQATVDLLGANTGQYLFISTTTVYERPSRHLPMTEATPQGNPFSEYAQKKQACEDWLQAQQTKVGLPLTIVRPSHTYSKRWIPNVATSTDWTFAHRLLKGLPVFIPGNGSTPWTLTHTRDFAVGLAGLVGHPKALGEAFQIVGDEVLTWKQIYQETARALGVKAPDIAEVPVDFICDRHPIMVGKLKGDKSEPGIFDNTKIKSFVPAFRSTIPFSEGIRESVEWFLAHPEAQTINPQFDGIFEDVVNAWRSR